MHGLTLTPVKAKGANRNGGWTFVLGRWSGLVGVESLRGVPEFLVERVHPLSC